MIKRFKFLVIILVLSIDSKINCSDFPRKLEDAIYSYYYHPPVDFSNLTPEQKACYIPQIHKEECGWMPIHYCCYRGNVSLFNWLLSNGVVADQKCFSDTILGANPQAEIVSKLLSHGLYAEYIDEKPTLQIMQEKVIYYSGLVEKKPIVFGTCLAEAKKILDLIKQHKEQEGGLKGKDGLCATGVSAVPGASYAGAGSGVFGVTEIEE